MKNAKKLILIVSLLFLLCPTSVFAASKTVTAKYVGEKITITSNKKGKKYQWQEKKKGKKWKNLKNQKKRKIIINAKWNKNQNQYRCVITNKKGKKSYSKTTTLNIEKNPIITKQPETQYTRKSGNVYFETDAIGGDELEFVWQTSSNKKTWINRYEGKTYNLEAADNTVYVRCKIKNTITKGVSYTNVVQLIVTDADTKYYWYEIPKAKLQGLIKPKAVDKHIYVSAYDSKYVENIKQACNTINKKTNKTTFIFTESQQIADIIVTDYDKRNGIEKNVFNTNKVVEVLNEANSDKWSGVAFAHSTSNDYFLIALNRKYMDNTNAQIRTATIIHELGHCIGIGHNNIKSSIMYSGSVGKMSPSDINNFLIQINKIEKLQNNIYDKNIQEVNRCY